MKRFLFLLFTFILLVGCVGIQKTTEECFNAKFTSFAFSEGLDTLKGTVTVAITNTTDNNIFVDAVDLYLYFDDIKLDRIYLNLDRSAGRIAANSIKNFKFKVKFSTNKNTEGLTWGNRKSGLLLAGLIYYRFPFRFDTSKCIVESYYKRG
jgi:hypothetical protein